MRAFAIRKYGGPEVLEEMDLPLPAVGPRDVRWRVHAASVNPIDWKTRLGKTKAILPYKLPVALGSDGSGVVTAVGSEVTRVKVGDEVWVRQGKDRIGTFAEEAVAHEDVVAKKPPALSHVEAASLPLVALTAMQSLVDVAQVKPGQKLLVHAAAGGVGAAAVQIGKYLGLQVIGTASQKNEAFVRALGADEVIDYRRERFEAKVQDADVVLDGVGDDTQLRSFQAVRPGGIVVSLSTRPDLAFARSMGMSSVLWPVLAMMGFRANFAAWRRGARYTHYFMKPSGAGLEELGRMVEAGRLKAHVDRVFPFAQTHEAMAWAESGKARGKVVIQMLP